MKRLVLPTKAKDRPLSPYSRVAKSKQEDYSMVFVEVENKD